MQDYQHKKLNESRQYLNKKIIVQNQYNNSFRKLKLNKVRLMLKTDKVKRLRENYKKSQ